jgi:hypothetical protein
MQEVASPDPKRTLYALGTIGAEVLSRGLGWLDFKSNSNKHTVWKVSETTKSVMTDEVRALYNTDCDTDGGLADAEAATEDDQLLDASSQAAARATGT